MKELKDIKNLCSGNMVSNGKFECLGHSNIIHKNNLLTFCDDIKYLPIILKNDCVTALITYPEYVYAFKEKKIGLISSKSPRLDFFNIHNSTGFKNKNFSSRIGKNSNISSTSIISKNNVSIGNNCFVEDNVIIHSNVKIGNNVIIRAGSILGGEGYQFWKYENKILGIKHFGKVVINDNVEIKEFCTIHKALFNWDITSVGLNTKIDAHTHIGHANKIGNNVYVCSHANISGNSVIENDSYIGPGVNIPNRINISKGSKLSVGSTITTNISDGKTVSGNFAIEHEKYLKHIKKISK